METRILGLKLNFKNENLITKSKWKSIIKEKTAFNKSILQAYKYEQIKIISYPIQKQ